jgi:predicted ArsR family transcriptional regulator
MFHDVLKGQSIRCLDKYKRRDRIFLIRKQWRDVSMFSSVCHDLLKPQWLDVLRELKVRGGMAVSDLSREMGMSYMTVKQYCEDLTKLGYLKRLRVPRTGIGRPEIFYRLGDKAEGMMATITPEFTLGMLEYARLLFGETAPEKLLFQYFQEREVAWKERVSGGTTLLYRAGLLAKIREKEGLYVKVMAEDGDVVRREYHHPLGQIFEKYPRAVVMEQRAMEGALGCRIRREVVSGAGGAAMYVDYVLAEN